MNRSKTKGAATEKTGVREVFLSPPFPFPQNWYEIKVSSSNFPQMEQKFGKEEDSRSPAENRQAEKAGKEQKRR